MEVSAVANSSASSLIFPNEALCHQRSVAGGVLARSASCCFFLRPVSPWRISIQIVIVVVVVVAALGSGNMIQNDPNISNADNERFLIVYGHVESMGCWGHRYRFSSDNTRLDFETIVTHSTLFLLQT